MNVNNQQGRLWLLAEKTSTLENMYNDLGQIAREMGCDSYPYKSENWLPHIKIVDLPEDTSTQIKDPTFGVGSGITFTVSRFEWTVQKGPEPLGIVGSIPILRVITFYSPLWLLFFLMFPFYTKGDSYIFCSVTMTSETMSMHFRLPYENGLGSLLPGSAKQ